MASAAGIIIVAGAITLGNDALSAPYEKGATNVAKYVNWKVIPATGLAAMLFAGLEQVNGTLARGLAGVVVLTTLVHSYGSAPSPIVKLTNAMGLGTASKTPAGLNAPLNTQTGPISV